MQGLGLIIKIITTTECFPKLKFWTFQSKLVMIITVTRKPPPVLQLCINSVSAQAGAGLETGTSSPLDSLAWWGFDFSLPHKLFQGRGTSKLKKCFIDLKSCIQARIWSRARCCLWKGHTKSQALCSLRGQQCMCCWTKEKVNSRAQSSIWRFSFFPLMCPGKCLGFLQEIKPHKGAVGGARWGELQICSSLCRASMAAAYWGFLKIEMKNSLKYLALKLKL